jgi:hypothetical protein
MWNFFYLRKNSRIKKLSAPALIDSLIYDTGNNKRQAIPAWLNGKAGCASQEIHMKTKIQIK